VLTLLATSISNTWREMRANKLRTALSLLGVSIGIFCIVCVLSIVDSLKGAISESFADLGSDVLYVGKWAWMPEPGEKEYPWWKYKARPVCTQAEMKELNKRVPSIGAAAMLYGTNSKIQSAFGKVDNVEVQASTYDFSKVQNIDINEGRYFTLSEMNGVSNAIILGNSLKQDLFGNHNCLGASVKLLGRQFKVIGYLKKKGKSMTGFDFDGKAIMSYNYLNSITNFEKNAGEWGETQMLIKPKPGQNFKEMCSEVKGALRALRKIKPKDKESFSFNLLSMVQASIDSIFAMLNLAGIAIGIFSLLVGAFGIANIMFVTVRERTSQIGLKKAIGAPRRTILLEFLLESIILCVIGGLCGVLLVWLLTAGAAAALDFPLRLSSTNFMIGIVVSTLVGIIAGYVPAQSASKLNPVTAIRS
jgi:putative ABC transport system permease protein